MGLIQNWQNGHAENITCRAQTIKPQVLLTVGNRMRPAVTNTNKYKRTYLMFGYSGLMTVAVSYCRRDAGRQDAALPTTNARLTPQDGRRSETRLRRPHSPPSPPHTGLLSSPILYLLSYAISHHKQNCLPPAPRPPPAPHLYTRSVPRHTTARYRITL